jgi:serine/threonine protein kinase
VPNTGVPGRVAESRRLGHPGDVIEPGTTIGAFRVEGLLGKGGMASVFRAVQVRLDRPVALKVLNPALAADEKFFERFKIEGINAARLDHANIVPIYEAGEDQGYAFLAMKLIDGESFSSVISRHRVLPPDETVRVLTDVSRALDYAHGRGFVHRDVKPANILIDRAGHVFLSDFGLSKDMGSRGITATGQWMGTAEYMAPEQAAGRTIDFRADLYALGCVAYECLTGDPPFLADSPLAVMMAHANADIPSATMRNSSLPSGVDLVIHRSMSKDPDDRYPAALALVDSLQAAVNGEALTHNAEPAGGFRLYSGPHTPVREPVDAPVPHTDQPSWPMSAPPQAPPTNLVCPRCVGPVEPDDVFCGGCGARILWCRTCKGPRIATDRFCSHCGAVSEASDTR